MLDLAGDDLRPARIVKFQDDAVGAVYPLQQRLNPLQIGEGLRLVRLDWIPAWWPLLPLLDARITVQVETGPVGSAP